MRMRRAIRVYLQTTKQKTALLHASLLNNNPYNVLQQKQLLLRHLQQRLKSADCEVTDIIDHGGVRSVYFTDPNGIALEASWWVHDPTGSPANYHDPRQFADPNPVLAFSELDATGNLTTVPRTRLA